MTTEKKTTPSKGRTVRRKGHSHERMTANSLRRLDANARRNVTETQQGSYDITTKLPVAIQCKCFSRWHVSPHDVYEQAHKHADGRIPVGCVKIDNKKPVLAIISWDDFLNFLEAYVGKEVV